MNASEPRRPGYDFGAALIGLIVIALGIAFLIDALDVAELRFEVILPIAAIAVGMMVIASSLLRAGRDDEQRNDHGG